MPHRAGSALTSAALVSLIAGSASAQVTAGGDLQRFTPSGTPYTGFAAAAGELLAPGEFALGGHVNYARNPLVFLVDGHRTASSIRDNTTLQLHAVMGILERLELSLGLPIVLHQGGGDPLYAPSSSTALGDLRLRPRVQILQQWKDGISLTLSPTLTIPLQRGASLNSEGSVRFLPEAGISWRGPRWFYSADALFRWRLTQQPVDRVIVGRELELVAAAGRVVSQDVEAIFELNGGLALETMSQGTRGNPLEALVGLRFRLGESWTLDVEAGAGIFSAPGVPDFRGVAGLTWGSGRPRTSETCVLHDPAGDRVVRMTGHDSDGDGIDDACDLCPYESSSEPSGCPAKVVCEPPPEPVRVALAPPPPAPPAEPPPAPALLKRHVVMLPVQFAFDKDKIRPSSIKLIKRVVDELLRLPSIMIVRVHGHTDDRGTHEYNLDLSRRRSEAVVREMIKLGADAKRISIKALGKLQPAERDGTDKSRQKNRRVEFVFSLPEEADAAPPPASPAALPTDPSSTLSSAPTPAPTPAPTSSVKAAQLPAAAAQPTPPIPPAPAEPAAAPPGGQR